MNDTQPGLFTKIIGTLFLLTGSILAYVFVVKIFICIWNRHTYLLPGFVALVAGVLIYGGTKQWERWRLALGRIWLALCGLAFFNSFYSKSNLTRTGCWISMHIAPFQGLFYL